MEDKKSKITGLRAKPIPTGAKDKSTITGLSGKSAGIHSPKPKYPKLKGKNSKE